jgi:hypothetical protein
MIGSFCSLNLDASFEILKLRMTVRLDQEVAYVSLYLRLKSGLYLIFDFTDIPFSVECCERRVSFLPILPTGHCAFPYMGSCW